MPRMCRVVTTSTATLEAIQPPYNLKVPEPGANLSLGLSLVDAAGAQQPDLICLPEGFLGAGLTSNNKPALAEPIPGPVFDQLAARARRYHTYVVAGLYLCEGSRVYNCAVLIDRRGEPAGIYRKKHLTEREIESGMTPGDAAMVFDTDFGRVGLAVCFDMNWPQLWADMKNQGAEVVCWLSAFEGGLPLQVYAWTHGYRIVTSVWPYHARVIDITGRIVAMTSRWSRLATCDLNLDKRLFHTDGQADRLLAIQAKYGRRVEIETFTEEALITLSSLDPQLTEDEVIAEFGLTDYQAFIARSTAAQVRARPVERS
jgi:predicted amidohydrolase